MRKLFGVVPEVEQREAADAVGLHRAVRMAVTDELSTLAVPGLAPEPPAAPSEPPAEP